MLEEAAALEEAAPLEEGTAVPEALAEAEAEAEAEPEAEEEELPTRYVSSALFPGHSNSNWNLLEPSPAWIVN